MVQIPTDFPTRVQCLVTISANVKSCWTKYNGEGGAALSYQCTGGWSVLQKGAGRQRTGKGDTVSSIASNSPQPRQYKSKLCGLCSVVCKCASVQGCASWAVCKLSSASVGAVQRCSGRVRPGPPADGGAAAARPATNTTLHIQTPLQILTCKYQGLSCLHAWGGNILLWFHSK